MRGPAPRPLARLTGPAHEGPGNGSIPRRGGNSKLGGRGVATEVGVVDAWSVREEGPERPERYPLHRTAPLRWTRWDRASHLSGSSIRPRCKRRGLRPRLPHESNGEEQPFSGFPRGRSGSELDPGGSGG